MSWLVFIAQFDWERVGRSARILIMASSHQAYLT
jgi:hypothetical protein